MSISASMVKELRERTGAGMMECKKALVETGGDANAAAELLRKSGARSGDVLLLTKALGTGIVLTAARADAADPVYLQAAVNSMLRLNRHPSHLAKEAGAHACTDITGFGLIGHAAEMARASHVRIVLEASQAPALPGAMQYIGEGHITGGASRNRAGVEGHVEIADGVPEDVEHLLFDAQTSGGLLIAVAPDAADALASALDKDDFLAARVGRVEPGSGIRVEA